LRAEIDLLKRKVVEETVRREEAEIDAKSSRSRAEVLAADLEVAKYTEKKLKDARDLATSLKSELDHEAEEKRVLQDVRSINSLLLTLKLG